MVGTYNSGGGRGAGRCEQRLRLEMQHLRKLGYLVPGIVAPISWNRSGKPSGSILIAVSADSIELRYAANGEPVREFVAFRYTTAGFGRRARFECPGCGRPCDVLYIGTGARFRCRLCLRLTYDSQYDAGYERARERALKLKRKCDPGAKITDGFPQKPKWMRWGTYQRLRKRHDDLMQRYCGGFAAMALRRFGCAL